MKALLFCTSNKIIRYLLQTRLFDEISILVFTKDKLFIESDLINRLNVIRKASCKKDFSFLLKKFDKSYRCFSFGCSYIFDQSDINHFDFPILNFHTGLIPENRGRTPLFWDIVNNASHSYGTLHAINSDIDMGIKLDIVKTSIIENDNPRTLADKLVTQLIKSKLLIKWLTSSIEDIKSNQTNLSKGEYRESFSPSKNYLSKEYTYDFFIRLWRCYKIWGRIKINGIYLKEISRKNINKDSFEFVTSDNLILYGVKLD